MVMKFAAPFKSQKSNNLEFKNRKIPLKLSSLAVHNLRSCTMYLHINLISTYHAIKATTARPPRRLENYYKIQVCRALNTISSMPLVVEIMRGKKECL